LRRIYEFYCARYRISAKNIVQAIEFFWSAAASWLQFVIRPGCFISIFCYGLVTLASTLSQKWVTAG